MPDPSLLFDGLIALLLAVAIGFALVLNRRLSVLRESKADLERLVGGLHSAIDKAERNLGGLRETAETAGRPLQEKLDAAARIRDELEGLIGRAEKAAERIELGLGRVGKLPQARPAGSAPAFARNKAEAARPDAAPNRAGGAAEATGRLPPAHAALIQALKGVR